MVTETLGAYDVAARLNEKALSIFERVVGPQHPNTLISRSNLALAYCAVEQRRR